ncbi:MAG: dihydropteroate synthase [Verrucomicrobiae bacterium]|nr:dihydropteroate synthase [Verrucomicrobiae bacterium]
MKWKHNNGEWDLSQNSLIMGILNVTPDSFSDGGQFLNPETALQHAETLIQQRADIIDIGGESTRPGSQPISQEEELKRILPVLKLLAQRTSIPLSIDTTKPEIARICLEEGATIINDVSSAKNPDMINLIAKKKCGYILMHSQGTPATMQQSPIYQNIVDEISNFFETQLQHLKTAGVDLEHVVIDPGFGFGKTWEHNRTLFLNLEYFHRFNRPLMVGISRKSFVGKITETLPQDRLGATLAMETLALWQGACIIRTHEVAPTRQIVKMVAALKNSSHELD